MPPKGRLLSLSLLARRCLELKEAVAASHAPPSKDAPPPLVADLVAELERDLYAVRASLQRAGAASRAQSLDAESSRRSASALSASIAQAQGEAAGRRAELERARGEVEHLGRCERLKERIVAQPACSATRAEAAALEEENAELRAAGAAAEAALIQRRGQARALARVLRESLGGAGGGAAEAQGGRAEKREESAAGEEEGDEREEGEAEPMREE